MSDKDIDGLLTAIPLAALLVAPNERILGANARALALLGINLRGRHFITAIRQPGVLDAVEGVMRDGQLRETRYLTNDGARDMTYKVTVSHIKTSLAEGVLLCFEDITHVEQAGQIRRDFVANVSHELRTPLTAMMGFIETLRGPARDDAAARDRFLGIMAGEAARMERLVKDLLSLSRVESDERLRPNEHVDIAALTDSVFHTLAPLAQDAGVTLVRGGDTTATEVIGDPDQLRQVLSNLIENAIKYGGAEGTVTVQIAHNDSESALRGPGVSFAISDRGPGIDPLHLPRLTERFYRVDSHRSREMGGTGLGLAIVKHIINRHRGRLRIESALGEGSTFTVILPAAPRSDPSAP